MIREKITRSERWTSHTPVQQQNVNRGKSCMICLSLLHRRRKFPLLLSSRNLIGPLHLWQEERPWPEHRCMCYLLAKWLHCRLKGKPWDIFYTFDHFHFKRGYYFEIALLIAQKHDKGVKMINLDFSLWIYCYESLTKRQWTFQFNR